MDYNKPLQAIKDHVSKWFSVHHAPRFYYHNLSHTKDVAAAAAIMAAHYRLNERDTFITQAAAWFHDIAYQSDQERHEEKGAQQAAAFLQGQGIDETIIGAVQGCILATKLPQNPTGLLQQIICDADLFHLGRPDFAAKNKMLRKEMEAKTNREIKKSEWRLQTLHFLQNHHFFTEYCRQNLTGMQQKHVAELKEKTGDAKQQVPVVAEREQQTDADPGTRKKKDGQDKMVELMFRITSTNNLRLSDMADNKAHIMITVNSIIVSVFLSVMVRQLNEYTYLVVPAILLSLVNLFAIFFSVLATRPRVPRGIFSQEQIEEKAVNLLFFGNYFRMDFDAYSDAMSKMMGDQAFLYQSLKRDNYEQGRVLSRKYRLLRIAYSVFMYGLVAATVAFFIATWLHKG